MAKRWVLTRHAQDMMSERSIKATWIDQVMNAPELIEVDPRDANRRFAFGRIAEFGGRWLRIVFAENSGEQRVITAFFDRGKEKRR